MLVNHIQKGAQLYCPSHLSRICTARLRYQIDIAPKAPRQILAMSGAPGHTSQLERDNTFLNQKRGGDPQKTKLHNYLVSKSYRPHPALDKLQEVSTKHVRGGMVSPPDSIAILQLLVKLTQAKTAIEVGVFTGYTSLGIALALPPNGKLHALDLSEEYANIGKPYWEEAGVSNKIQLHIGQATDSLEKLSKELPPESVDLAFVDADKRNYDKYYEALLAMLRPGGAIVIDNVLWGGGVIDESNQTDDTKGIRAINSKLFEDKRVTIAMLKNSDGMTVAVKN